MTQAIKSAIADVIPLIRSWGFKGSVPTFRLITNRFVLVINFQGSSGGSRYYVNLGVQPLFVQTEGESLPDAKQIKEYECIFRDRVDPPEDLPGWPYDESYAPTLMATLTRAYEQFLIPISTIPGPVTEVTVDDFPDGSAHLLFGPRHSDTFLHFARIALATDQLTKAHRFAMAGLEICPERASTLRAHLKDALAKATK